MSDETTRAHDHAGDTAQASLERYRAGDPDGRLYVQGHVSFETAHISAGYPYGRRGKCLRAVWIESKPRHGFRFVYRTTAPYYPEDGQEAPAPNVARWNKPKASTYYDVAVLYLTGHGHVEYDILGAHAPTKAYEKDGTIAAADREADIDAFELRARAGISDTVAKAILALRAFRRACSRMTFEVTSAGPIDLSDKAALAKAAEEQESERDRQANIGGALMANEKASINGAPLPYPALGTAAHPFGHDASFQHGESV